MGVVDPKVPLPRRERADRASPSHLRLGVVGLAVLLTLAAFLTMRVAGPLLDALDHWSADLRTAFFTYKLESAHPSVALVYINEDAIEQAQKDGPARYMSPVDRGLVAHLVDRLDGLGAKAIGIDLVVDQPSEAAKDAALLAAIRRAKAHVVMARLDLGEGRALATPSQAAYHSAFIGTMGRASGYVTVKSDMDGVVRARPSTGTDGAATFAEEIAKAGGWDRGGNPSFATTASDRIAWLQAPADDSTTFVTLSAQLLMAPPDKLGGLEKQTLAEVAGKLVIVGVRLIDGTDKHKTPLGNSIDELTPGPEINAHVAAQLVDGRRYLSLTRPAEVVLWFVTALFGIVVSSRWPDSVGRTGSLLYGVFLGGSAMIFWWSKLILPFAAPSLIWGGAVLAGWLLRRRGGVASDAAKGSLS